MKKKGILFVVSAPSGAGKTTLINKIVNVLPDIFQSVSHTTRNPRSGEMQGRDYHYISKEKFKLKVECGDFIESAEVHGNYYGTSFESINLIKQGKQDLILDIDVQGAEQLRKKGVNGCYIFILPPSIKTLLERLKERGADSTEVIERRVKTASDEITHYKNYDYIIVNDDLEKSILLLESIIRAERCRYPNLIPE